MACDTLLLSVDLEDWHQLVRRRLGLAAWDRTGFELERQTAAMLRLLDAIDARATFFVLGMVARQRPQLVTEIAGRGHEIACHGDGHYPVHQQTRDEFADDVRRAVDAIGDCTGARPRGYRAPAFSIDDRARPWALDVLADAGFEYDSSQHVSLRPVGRRTMSEPLGPHPLELASGARLWELPVAGCELGAVTVPIGGASYWSLLPERLGLSLLLRAPQHSGLYLHPHELGPDPLRIEIPAQAGPRHRAQATLRTARRELARRRTPAMLTAIARRFSLIPFGNVHATLSQRPRSSSAPLSG
jgi:polysaccharide deacetylase family protein (PEP-CTERM system associated)